MMDSYHLLLSVVLPKGATERMIKSVILEACGKSGAHVISNTDHEFYPCGYSLLVLLAESHVSIHTWPESGRAFVDYFSCSSEPGFDLFEECLEQNGFLVIEKLPIIRSASKEEGDEGSDDKGNDNVR